MAKEDLIPIRDSEHARELAAKSAAVRKKKSDDRKEREARRFLLEREQLTIEQRSRLVASSILDGLLVGDIEIKTAREAAQVLTCVSAMARAEQEQNHQPRSREETIATIRAIQDRFAPATTS